MSAPSKPRNTAADPAARAGFEQNRLLLAAGALLLAGVLAAVAPLLNVVTAVDGSSTSPPVHSGWIAGVPILLVLIVAAARRPIAAAAISGAGVFGLVRLIADLGVVIDPGETLRPELFGIDTTSDGRLQVGFAGWLLVLADVLMLAAAVFAGSRLADSLEPVVQMDPFGDDDDDAGRGEGGRLPASRPRLMRATPAAAVGLLAAGGYLASNLGQAYREPLPVIRSNFTDIGLWGTITAAVAGLLIALVVLLSTAVDAGMARGLLLGLALAASAPPLIAIVGSAGNAAATPSGSAWLGLISCVLLLVAAFLRRGPGAEAAAGNSVATTPATAEPIDEGDEGVGARRLNLVVGALALVAGAMAIPALLLPQAAFVFRSFLDPGSTAAGQAIPDEALTADFAAAGSIYLLVAALLLGGGLMTLLPRTADWGRRLLTLAWVPSVAALLFAFEYVNNASKPTVIYDTVFQADTTFRAGLWWGLAATILAIAVGIAAPLVTGRVKDNSLDEPDPVELIDRSPWAIGIAGAITVLVLIGLSSQSWTSDQGSSSALFAGAGRTDLWGIWLCAVAAISTVWLAVRQPRRETALVLFLVTAVVLLPRLILTPSVTAQTGFSLLTGFWLNVVLVVLVVAAGVVTFALIPALGTAAGGEPEPIGRTPKTRPSKSGSTPVKKSATTPTKATSRPRGKTR